MLDFTDNMKRIAYYREQALRHAAEKEFDACRDDVAKILIHGNEAMQQIDNLIAISMGVLPPCNVYPFGSEDSDEGP